MGDEYIRQLVQLGFHKRAYFKSENEWRGVLYQPLRPEPGVNIPVDLSELILDVWVSSDAPAYFIDVVNAVAEKFHLNKQVLRSDLRTMPIQQ